MVRLAPPPMSRPRVLIAAAVVVAASSAALAHTGKAPKLTERSVYALANRCLTLGTHRSDYLKPTGLGTFMLYTRAGLLVSTNGLAKTAGPATEWRIAPDRSGTAFTIRSTLTHRSLPGSPEAIRSAMGCRAFPEAGIDATGRTFAGVTRGGKVFGFVDPHLHITGDMRAGGDVIYAPAFSRFGIVQALGRDAKVHGKDGRLDLTGNLLRTGVPVGTHDTHGWPTFTGWPTYYTETHQQVYYRWLQRTWEAGLRLIVAQTVDDSALCRLEPRKRTPCDETKSII